MSSMKDKDILIIDDTADIRLLTKKILEGDGALVMEADNIDGGLALAAKKAPQLIVLDLELPEKSGFDFLKARKDMPALKEVPVIILSGRKDKASVSQAIALGADDYLIKPFRATFLLQKVRKALRLTSFLVKKFEADECPSAVFSLAADLLKVSEGGCQIEAPVKLGAGLKVRLFGEALEKFGVQELLMKALPRQGKYTSDGRYLNEIGFIGMDQDRAKKVRALLKDLQ